jgi:hypothetical protein
VSGLSTYDRAGLSASFYYFWDDRLNCERALRKLVDRADYAQAEKIIRTRFGCDSVSDKPRIVIDGIGYHTCLCNVQHALFPAYLELADRLEKGTLPDRGAYLDQPSHTLEALSLIARLKHEAQAAEAKQQEKKAKQHARK